jgi:hypothetical protein
MKEKNSTTKKIFEVLCRNPGDDGVTTNQEPQMTNNLSTILQAAIETLQARQPKPRGRRQEIAPHVEDLRALIAAGWTRSEIIGEVKARGGKMSPALLRDVLQIAPAKPKQVSRPKPSNRENQATPSPTSAPPPMTAPGHRFQPAALAGHPNKAQPRDAAE